MRQSFLSILFLVFSASLISFGIAPLEEFGKAGYYADSLHGRKTASGALYDKNELTCAHKSLPFGTKVRVTRLDNQKSVVVKVTDRGPYVDGFIVDLSRKAAEQIGLIKDGITRVKLDVIEASSTARVAAETDGNTKLLMAREESKQSPKGAVAPKKSVKPLAYSHSDPEPAQKGTADESITTELYQVALTKPAKRGYGVQVSTLYNADNILPEVKKLQGLWPGKALVLTEKSELNSGVSYKIIIGAFGDKKAAEAQQKLAAKKGYKGCFVVDLAGM
jgi:rare lipoprotein A